MSSLGKVDSGGILVMLFLCRKLLESTPGKNLMASMLGLIHFWLCFVATALSLFWSSMCCEEMPFMERTLSRSGGKTLRVMKFLGEASRRRGEVSGLLRTEEGERGEESRMSGW